MVLLRLIFNAPIAPYINVTAAAATTTARYCIATHLALITLHSKVSGDEMEDDAVID